MEFEGVGIGESDFKMLRMRKNYFIDKSLYIKDIIDNDSKVILVTRPRRFGKTLNMSMLKYFFDCDSKDSKEMFKGLKIMEQSEKYISQMGAYPCIYLTMKDLNVRNFEFMLMQLKTAIMEIFFEKRYLLESEIPEGERVVFNKILAANINEMELLNSIKMLTRMLCNYYNKPVMLFIDEYDVPLQTAYVEGYYEEAIKFLRTFYVTTFKDNAYLKKTVLTGVSRVAKESIFSGANNFDVYTVLDNEFADDFGITSEEVDKALKDFDLEEQKEEVKKWYDGYRIGNVEGLYNPWSLLNFLSKKELVPYWVNTSSNDLIKLTMKNSVSVKEKMERLLKGEAIEVPINLETIIVGIENNEDNVWGLMLGTGYLKVVETVNLEEGIYKVELPNYEIKLMFQEMVREWFKDKGIGNNLKDILKDLVDLNLYEFERKFRVLVEKMFSYMDVGRNTAENFYHAFVLGILVGLKDIYYVNSNRESGFGRYDIMLEPQDKSKNSFIIEFNVADEMDEPSLEQAVENGKKQIEEKDYENSLKERGFRNITKMVFAFKGKDFKIAVL